MQQNPQLLPKKRGRKKFDPSSVNFDKPLLNTQEAALYLGVAYGTLRTSRQTGTLLGYTAPPYLKLGEGVKAPAVYKRADLDLFIDQLPRYDHTAQVTG